MISENEPLFLLKYIFNIVLVSGVEQSDIYVCVCVNIYIYTHINIYIQELPR